MTILTVAEAQSRLPDVIHKLTPGEEVALTEGDRIVARIVGDARPVLPRPRPGLAKDMLEIISDDDEHLKDFAEYMP
jgi:antitoxin (DNA-binding transcriptional repressor) of toxin-antitoxin stability system